MADTYGKVSGTFEEIEKSYGKVSLVLGKKLMNLRKSKWRLGRSIYSF
jgi:hypothetical protein